MLAFIVESLNTTNFNKKKPTGKLAQKETNKAALCDLNS